MKDPETTTPFCGTGYSSTWGENRVEIGKCGKCQINAWGGGGESQINATQATGPGEGPYTSCGRDMVCCESGKCAADHLSC